MTNLSLPFQVKHQVYDKAKGLRLQANFSYGFDGMGGLKPYNGPTYHGASIVNGSIIYGGMYLSTITIKESREVVFKVPHMASNSNERPILLIDGVEDSPTLDKIFENFNEEHDVAEATPVVITFDGDKKLTIDLKLKCAQMDGKVIKMAQGRLGAYCLMCSRSRKDCHNPALVANGMNVDLTTQEINATFDRFKQSKAQKQAEAEANASNSGDNTHETEEAMIDRQDGVIDWFIDTKKINVDLRSGQTHAPKTTTIEICNILPPLHCKLRAVDWCIDMMLRFSSGLTIRNARGCEVEKTVTTPTCRGKPARRKESPGSLRLALCAHTSDIHLYTRVWNFVFLSC